MAFVKNIIFDLGGVLMNLDYSKTTEAFKDLGYTDFENMYTQFRANRFFDDLETGKISEETFYRYLIDASGGRVTHEQVKQAWNAMLLDFRESSFGRIERLSPYYNVYLLSNTNTIHKAAFDRNFSSQMNGRSLDSFFTKTYYSHRVGMRKPNEDIFRYVAKNAGIDPADTLFVDDLMPNVETARKLGFKAHFLLGGQMIEDLDYKSF